MIWDGEPTLWIAADATRALGLETAIESVQRAFHVSLAHPDPELRDSALGIVWRKIVVLPLLHGRWLTPNAWVFAYDTAVATKSNWSEHMPTLVPLPLLVQLQITGWDLPEIKRAHDIIQEVVRLRRLVGSLRDIANIPGDLDVLGLSLAMQRIQSMEEAVTRCRDEIKQQLAALANSGSVEIHETVAVLNQLVTPTPGPAGNVIIQLNNLDPWVEQLDMAISVAVRLFLQHADDCIQQVEVTD